MAGFNPFRKFRVYQKYALAALGIMAMISFVILPSYFMLQNNRQAGAEGMIATCRRAGYGNVDQYLLRNLRENHHRLAGFYNLLASQLAQSVGGSPWEFYAKYPILFQIRESYQQRTSDEELISKWLLTRYAQEKGMVIPDKLIEKRLQTISGGDISNQMLDEIYQQLDLSDSYLIYLLREEMLANYLQRSFIKSMISITPLDRWMLFQRVNRSLTAEVAVISVESFQKEVKEPSEAELKKFFEENKNRVYNPNLPDSGFEIPTKFAFQIVDATPSEQLLASITQEEIEKFYEENKATHFLRQTARPQGSQGSTQSPGSLPFDLFPTVPGGSRPGGLLPGLDSLPGPGLNLDLNTPTPAEEKDEGQGTRDEEPLEFPGKMELTPEEDLNDDPFSLLATPTAVYRSVAYRQEEEPTDTIKVTVTSEGEAVADATVTFLSNDEEAVPVSGVTDENGVAVLDIQPLDGLSEETPPSEEETPKFDPNILYQPLEEVEDTIRQILANQKAEGAIKEIEKKMKAFYTSYTVSRSKELTPINLTTLAAEYQLNVVTVETPLSVYDVQQHECWQNPAYRSYLVKMFGENSSPFEVLVGQQTSQLFPNGGPMESIGWVTKRESRRVPEFTDEGIKELVRDRYLTVHARELAEKRAKELADLANQSKDQPLAVSLAGQDVSIVETGPFTWFTRSLAQTGYARAQLVFGEVREMGVPRGTADYNNVHIKAPGVNFMETAYSLQPGESGVAMNQPQMLVFVIRLVGSTPHEELLWSFFVTTPLMDYEGAGKEDSQREMMRKWLEEIERNVGFQWVNRPKSFQSRDEE